MVNLIQDLKPISYVKAHTTEIVKYEAIIKRRMFCLYWTEEEI
jgi:hypothetical protein